MLLTTRWPRRDSTAYRELGVAIHCRVSQTTAAVPFSSQPKGPIAEKLLCKGGIAVCSGVFGVSRFTGDRTTLDRQSQDSGPIRLRKWQYVF